MFTFLIQNPLNNNRSYLYLTTIQLVMLDKMIRYDTISNAFLYFMYISVLSISCSVAEYYFKEILPVNSRGVTRRRSSLTCERKVRAIVEQQEMDDNEQREYEKFRKRNKKNKEAGIYMEGKVRLRHANYSGVADKIPDFIHQNSLTTSETPRSSICSDQCCLGYSNILNSQHVHIDT